MRILAKGANVTVWRGEGDDGPMEEVLSSSAVPTLTTVSMWFISGASAAFAYDDIEIIADGWTADTTFATNTGNELTSSTFGGVTTTYGYDAWGQMTSKARGSYTATYAWHYGGKLTGVTSSFPGEGNVTYAYGADLKRRQRNAGTNVSWYNWNLGAILLNEESIDGTLAKTYIAGLAEVSGDNPSFGNYAFYAPDLIGSTRKLLNNTASFLGSIEFSPYGMPYSSTGDPVSRGFTGHVEDSVAAIKLSPLRAYDATTSRWMQRDPVGMADGPNPYSYCGMSPVSRLDPYGSDWRTGDFLRHYLLGSGTTVDLQDVGLEDDYRREKNVQKYVQAVRNNAGYRIRQKARDLSAACYGGGGLREGLITWADSIETNFNFGFLGFLTNPLWVLGSGSLYGNATCSVRLDCCTKRYTYSCNGNFSQNDAFKDPLSGDRWALPFEIPRLPNTLFTPRPYDIVVQWAESWSGSG